ncbi:TraG family conjugative transposon ATPase [Sphingobacterium spiritivorum]|uniref:TraG family conjugative transposon ATPase n=1 Tax=Sphingobacterium spiritivorum TaxID=258 RepID=UPI003DA3AEFE
MTEATKILPIASVENNCILSANGDITLAYEIQLPEIFTLAEREYDAFHQAWIKAIKLLPEHTVLHKQDWFVKRTVRESSGKTFLSTSSDRFYSGRPYMAHNCYLFLTKKPEDRKPSNSAFCNILRKSIVPKQTVDSVLLRNFEDIAGQFTRVLEDSDFVGLHRLVDDELAGTANKAGIIERYCFLLDEGEESHLCDTHIGERMTIGNKHCEMYTLSDVEELPSMCGSRINYDRYSTDRTKFSIGFASTLGLLLDCDHLYNQYLFIGDSQKTIKELERKRLRLNSLSAYSRENSVSRDAVNDYLNDAVANQYFPVRAHFNVMVWDEDSEKLKDVRNRVSASMAKMDAVAKVESVGAPQIYWAGMGGNQADFPENDTFITFAEQATCFFNLESNYRSDNSGIRLSERLYGRPVSADLFNMPMKKGTITNRNLFVCGGSGGGKSMLMNHFLRTLYEDNAHCVVIDVGGSYKGLCDLLDGYYFIYTENNPIKFNPFYLSDGEVLDTEKKESLKTLLFSLWKKSDETYTRSEYVALSNALTSYYQKLDKHPDIFPSFNTFYEFLKDDYHRVLKSSGVNARDFDFENFLYVLNPYYEGGEFDYLLNAKENLDLLNERFIVFELDNIKSHEILFPVVTIIIMQMFISKMRKLKGRKVLAIDEAWIAIAKAGMAEFIKYLYKTIRKFNGIPALITQEVDDLISSPVIKETVVNLSDTKVFLDMRKFMNKFDSLQATLGLSEKTKTMMLSLNRANDPTKNYRELLIDQGGQSIKVYRNELSIEEYYAYTTELTEKLKVQEYADRCGSMEKGIAQLARELRMQKQNQ